LSRRRLKKHRRYAAQGISIGLAASLMIFCGLMIMFRLSAHRHIGHGVPFGFVLFTAILVWLVHRFLVVAPKSRRRPVTHAITELSKGEGNETKSA
jgi:uncharacterized membrane protein YgdD (TMEM256/DUF423 family)